MGRAVTVLDTAADLNLIHKSELPSGIESGISQGPPWNIDDANHRPLRAVWSIRHAIHLRGFLFCVEFIASEKLAVPLILGAHYCGKHVHAIFPRTRNVEIADGTEVPIIHRFTQRKSELTVGEVSKDE